MTVRCPTCGQVRSDVLPLTPKQLALLRLVHGYVTKHGMAPTLKELVYAGGYRSTNTVHRLLACCQDRGWLYIHPARARGIMVLHAPPEEAAGAAR